MGHREQLLEGAKKCLAEKGFVGTTARDLVAASGTNLASIGYHFGSKENLLATAMVEALGEWGDEVERVLTRATEATPMQRLESMWSGLIESILAQPGLWRTSFEVGQLMQNMPQLREQLAEAYDMARRGLVSLFLVVPEDEIDDAMVHTAGSFLLALIPGLAAQWVMDPDRAPSAAAMVEGLQQIMNVIHARHAK